MILLMKCLNEERSVKRVMDDIHYEDFIDRVIVIDGCSTDYTVEELLDYRKVEVYRHPWLDWYHDMEISQSNIALSYVPHGKIAFILDFDERCSDDLKEALADIHKQGMPHGADVVHVPRRTYQLVRYDDPYESPYGVLSSDGWPLLGHQIGQYPDFQCRIIRRTKSMHWVNSPHHVLAGEFKTVNLTEGHDLIHYEKDDYRDRERIERKWLRAQARRRELGLTPDIFETDVKPERAKYADYNYWKSRRKVF
jgi:glycosyltransferase involved in cell wall biosynthesis